MNQSRLTHFGALALCWALLVSPSPLHAEVVYDNAGGEVAFTDATYTCDAQAGGGILQCTPCLVQTDTALGIHMMPRSFVGSCGTVCNAWYGTLAGTVHPRITIDGILISTPSLLPGSAYWTSGFTRYWYWCPWEGTPSCQEFSCGLTIQIGSYTINGHPDTTEGYVLNFPVSEYGAGIPFDATFCNQAFSWGVGCGINGSINSRWKLIAAAPIRALVFPAGATPLQAFGGTNCEIRFLEGPGGITTVSLIPGTPPNVALPPFSLQKYWDINGAMPDSSFLAELRFAYDPGEIPVGGDAAKLQLFRLDEPTGQWIPVPATVDTSAHVVTSQQVDRLSRYALALRATRASVTTNPEGLSISVDGGSYSTPSTFTWMAGSTHEIATTSPQAIGVGSQYVWTDWSDTGELLHSISAGGDSATYTATFKTQHFLTLTSDSGGTVGPGDGFHDAGEVVAISASRGTSLGITFDRWVGTGVGSYNGQMNPTAVVMNSPITQEAKFRSLSAPSTLLHLRFEGSPNGESGEVPSLSQGLSYEWGSLGSGAHFGPGDDVRFPVAGNLDASTGTVEFWIKPRWDGNDGQDHYVLALGVGGGILIGKDAGNFWRIILNRFGEAGGAELGAGLYIDDWTANQWHHAAFTWSPQALRVYIDGVLLVTEIPSMAPPPVSATEFQLGGDGASAYLDAVLDEVRISGVERSDQDIHDNYLYWVVGVDESSGATPSAGFRLGPVFPNPVSSTTSVSFNLPEAGWVRLDLVDVMGRRVRLLVDRYLQAGRHVHAWDRRLEDGDLNSGVYWIVGYYGGQRLAKRVVLLR